MARFVYVDETGSVGKGAKNQPLLTLSAVLVDETVVQPLGAAFERVAWDHLGILPEPFELHGNEIWNGSGLWEDKSPPQLIEVYEQAISVLDTLDIEVAHSSIHKQRLHSRYGGYADENAYLLALQFLLEKVDRLPGLKILVADEAKEHELRAIKMVADLQDWGGGEVPGRKLDSIIDSMHFVRSHASPGVQLADLVAYALQRYWNQWDSHANAKAAISRIYAAIDRKTVTWRDTWPRTPR